MKQAVVRKSSTSKKEVAKLVPSNPPQPELSEQKKGDKRALHLSTRLFDKFRSIRDKANKKDFGKKASYEDVFSVLLDLVKRDEVIKKLQERSMRPKDHIDKIYQQYCQKNGKIDFNEFLLKALTKEIDVDLDLLTLTKVASSIAN